MSGKTDPHAATGAASRFFSAITAYPRWVLLLAAALVAGAAAQVPELTRDTSSRAFLPSDSPARDEMLKLEARFGQTSAVAIALISDVEGGVYSPEMLSLNAWWSQAMRATPGVDPGRVQSLTESPFLSSEGGALSIEPLVPAAQVDGLAQAQRSELVRARVASLPAFEGSVVSADGRATLLVGSLEAGADEEAVYEALLAKVDQAPPGAAQTHVAGNGAVSGYLGTYIERDARRMQPVAALLVMAVLALAYRSLIGVLLPGMVALGAVAVSVGAMARAGAPFYFMTNALPVLLMGVAVADSIHILAQYTQACRATPAASRREVAVATMVTMWRPVTTTSISDVVGLLGMGLMSTMPPMRDFGIYASMGIMGAWLLSVTAVPAALTLFAPAPEAAAGEAAEPGTRALVRLGALVLGHPRAVVAATAALTLFGLAAASQLRIDEDPIESFQHDEPLYLAEAAISEHLAGTHRLDIVVESPQGQILQPEHLRAVRDLQARARQLDHYGASLSVVDLIEQLSRTLDLEGDPLAGSGDTLSELLFLYELSGDTELLAPFVDADRSAADVQVYLRSGRYSALAPSVEALQAYIDEAFKGSELKVVLTGPTMVNYWWVNGIAASHFEGLALALAGVLLMMVLSYRSVVAGLLCMTPVTFSVVLIYGAMSLSGVWLGVGSSMFAAIAIGFGVDFAIHTLDRLIEDTGGDPARLDGALVALYPSIGRALLFSLAAIFLSFATITASEVPPLRYFGWLAGLALLTSFVVSLCFLPALIKLLRPAFLGGRRRQALP